MSVTNPDRSLLERIDLGRADDPRDVVHRAVAALAQGGGVVLAVEGVYGLAAGALHPEAVRSVCELDVDHRGDEGPPSARPLTLLLKGPDEVGDWVPSPSALGRRLARRAWPGPVTLVFDAPGPDDPAGPAPSLFGRLPAAVRSRFPAGSGVGFQVPAQRFVRDVLRLTPGPVVFRPLPTPAAGAADRDVPAARPETGFGLMIEGDGGGGLDAAVVRVGDEGCSLLHPGPLDAATLSRMAGTIILFVCTGNTCRSPMAEALCKVLLAERLGCGPGELEARGFVVASAGVAAAFGAPAAANAVEVVRQRGGRLQGHQSRRLTLDMLRHADHVLAMTGDHLETMLEHAPDSAPRVRLLHPDGLDVADPVGMDRQTYQRSASEIETYLRAWLAAAKL